MIKNEHEFNRYSAFRREIRDSCEIFDKKIIESEKAALEFSKILMTLLYSINAGGLVAIPAVLSFLGLATPEMRFRVLLWCAVGFGLGLVFTALSAILIHRNYRIHSKAQFIARETEIFQINKICGAYGNQVDPANRRDDGRKKIMEKIDNTLRWTNFGAYVFGGSALVCFIGACTWVGYNFI